MRAGICVAITVFIWFPGFHRDALAITPTVKEIAARAEIGRLIPQARLLWVRDDYIYHTSLGDWKPQQVVAGQRPRWSSNGKWFLYQAETSDGKSDVWVMNSDFSNKRLIIPGAHSADWTGDGDAITAIASDGYRVLKYDHTKKTTTLFDSRETQYRGSSFKMKDAAELRVGGRYLLTFTRDFNHATFVIDLQDKRFIANQHMLGGDCSPAWSPDGYYLLNTARTWERSRAVVRASFDAKTGSIGASKYFVGSGMCHYQRISNDGRWVVYAPDMKENGDREIYCWRIGDSLDKAVRLTFHSSTDVLPSLYVPDSSGGQSDALFDVNPIADLKLLRLANYKQVVGRATSYTPVIDELAGNEDSEASQIVRALEDFGRASLKRAREQRDVFQAQSIYVALVRQFEGHSIGEQATSMLRSAEFQRELKTGPELVKLRDLVARLRAVDGTKARYDDKQYLARNRAVLVQMVGLVANLQKNHPDTRAQREAAEVARLYALPAETTDTGNQRLVFDATIVATSKVPTLRQIAPYKEALTYIRYKVNRVISGDYDGDQIVVVFFVIRDQRYTAAATWKPGGRQRLTVDLFDAHADLQKITKTQDADDFELIPYCALKIESAR